MKILAGLFALLLSINIFAADMSITWDTPTKRVDGSVMGVNEIGGYEIYQTDAGNTEGARVLVGTADGLSTDIDLTVEVVVNKAVHFVMVVYDTDFVYSEFSSVASYSKSRPAKVIIRSIKIKFN